MVRSAGKNQEYVAILTDPADYDAFIAELEASGGSTSLELRRRLAARAFAATAAYDAMISQWFAGVDQGEKFPPVRAMASRLAMTLRYGENPHQEAALYLPMGPAAPGIAQARQVPGQEIGSASCRERVCQYV